MIDKIKCIICGKHGNEITHDNFIKAKLKKELSEEGWDELNDRVEKLKEHPFIKNIIKETKVKLKEKLLEKSILNNECLEIRQGIIIIFEKDFDEVFK